MIEHRLRRVFETMQEHDATCLLMGGQACVLYGAAEFSKDVDFVVLANRPNLDNLRKAMETLQKDWPMIQRLMEVRYLNGGPSPSDDERSFWFMELRTPELLIDMAGRFPEDLDSHLALRPLLRFARDKDPSGLERALLDEMLAEKDRDRVYWKPLRARLGELRRNR